MRPVFRCRPISRNYGQMIGHAGAFLLNDSFASVQVAGAKLFAKITYPLLDNVCPTCYIIDTGKRYGGGWRE